MTDSDPGADLPRPDAPRQDLGSKGVALTNWLVSRATGLLERRSSRRGFLIGTAMAGSAVAVAGCTPMTSPGPPYTHITDCSGGLCTDGYTEFCCSVNNGLNLCPPDSFAGGWWRADYSSFCNGTRYYIDCMQYCCGPATGYQSFCAGCTECRCANGCNTRRVYCNYFRYGQCHAVDIPTSGPIACRIVTCVPPYTVAEWDCSTALAVDNSTAEHAGNCAPLPPPPHAALLPSSGAAVQTDAGEVIALVRGADGALWHRDRVGGNWAPEWVSLGGALTSGIGVAASGSTVYAVVRGNNNGIWGNRRDGAVWSGWHAIGGAAASDPVVVADGSGFVMFVRGTDDNTWANRFNGAAWTGWIGAGGASESEPAVVRDAGGTMHVIVRGGKFRAYSNRFSGASFQGWVDGGNVSFANPTITTDGTRTVRFVRAIDGATWWSELSGSSWTGWVTLGGNTNADPIAFSDANGQHVLVRGLDNGLYHNRRNGGAWGGWTQLGGGVASDPVVATGPSGTFVFVHGTAGGLWHGVLDGDVFSGWVPLGGALAPVRGTP